MKINAIILAGGAGSRLYPLTNIVCKQLLPIYDKPMIYYPLSTVMLAGIKDVRIISTSHDVPVFQKLLGDGSKIGINLTYSVQDTPRGIADAFLVAEDHVQQADKTLLILGDNIFHGNLGFLRKALTDVTSGACVFAYPVKDPERYGVVEFDEQGNVLSLEEKPKVPKSNYVVPGLYLYSNDVVDICKNIAPSARGELEITDVNLKYLGLGKLRVVPLNRGMAWLDTGTPSSMLEASNYVATIEHRQGLKIACIEEIAMRQKFIDRTQFENLILTLPNSDYKSYLKRL